MRQPNQRKGLREYISGMTVWGKIGWMIVLGYIVGRIIIVLRSLV
ncbi:hypothetical protein [Brevibacillus dissolubilis]|nr:hypothetical protein [Brevibacillus dissolubilis]